jgi:alkylated DNA repair dioxygenase AlkB
MSKENLFKLVHLLQKDDFDEFKKLYSDMYDKKYDIITDMIPGLIYIPNFINEHESQEIMDMLKIMKWTGITLSSNSRRVAQFGYTYSYDRSGVNPTTPISDYFKKLISSTKINKIIGNKLNYEFDQLIINEYKPGHQISAHTDHVTYFDDMIACITIGQSVPISFQKNNEEKTIDVAANSMYIMTGDSRYLWKHCLKNNTKSIRYSLTFRKVKK